MFTTDAPAADVRVSIVVDLIGDLDATLGSIFAETLSNFIAAGSTNFTVSTKHAASATPEGLAAIDAAVRRARDLGRSIVVEPGSRRMKAAFATANLPLATGLTHLGERRTRHIMIARHSQKKNLARTA